jgi:hypothetical protein
VSTHSPPLCLTRYREIFHEIAFSAGQEQYAFDRIVLPYFPYFSNCKGFDSYMPIFSLLEDSQCGYPSGTPSSRKLFPTFPHKDDIKVVGPYNFFQSPIADVCERTVSCKYEEDLSQIDVNRRWFEVRDVAARQGCCVFVLHVWRGVRLCGAGRIPPRVCWHV